MIEIHERFVTFFPPQEAAYLIGDFTDWKQTPLPIKGPTTIEVPEGAYVEYAFLDDRKLPLADPENAMRPKNPWHEYDRSITLPHNPFTTHPRPQSLQGKIIEHTIPSHVFEDQRTYYVYEPSSFPHTTLYVQDGKGYCNKLRFHEVADVLIEQGVIQPIRLVMIEPQDRHKEYWFNESYERFVLEELFPVVDGNYGATKERGTWGASLGGLVSSWLAWRHPQIFTKVGSQSGCFKAHPNGGNEYRDSEWFTEQFANTPHLPLRFYVQTGQIEWLLAPNRRFAAVLADKDYLHKYDELPSGHAWATWEQGLASGLKYLFGSGSNEAARAIPSR